MYASEQFAAGHELKYKAAMSKVGDVLVLCCDYVEE